jgi:hypothetical protein
MTKLRFSSVATLLIVAGFLIAYVVMLVLDHKHKLEAEQIKTQFSNMVDGVFSLSFTDHHIAETIVSIDNGLITFIESDGNDATEKTPALQNAKLIADKTIRFENVTFDYNHFPFPQSELEISIKGLSVTKEVLNLLVLMNPSFFALHELLDNGSDQLVIDLAVRYELTPSSDRVHMNFSLDGAAAINVELVTKGLENYRLKHQQLSEESSKVDANLERLRTYTHELNHAFNDIRINTLDIEYADKGLMSSVTRMLGSRTGLKKGNIADLAQSSLNKQEIPDRERIASRIHDLIEGTIKTMKITIMSPDGLALYQASHPSTFRSAERNGIKIEIR